LPYPKACVIRQAFGFDESQRAIRFHWCYPQASEHARESIPAFPEKNAPVNFDAVMTKFVPIAATIALGFLFSG
jgi:hypothetical protein